jgi:hypothetical protein
LNFVQVRACGASLQPATCKDITARPSSWASTLAVGQGLACYLAWLDIQAFGGMPKVTRNKATKALASR